MELEKDNLIDLNSRRRNISRLGVDESFEGVTRIMNQIDGVVEEAIEVPDDAYMDFIEKEYYRLFGNDTNSHDAG